ncbi:hypothetical protein E5N72_14710 [Pseudoalteromonas sp. MEBiC 03607]|uniref:hypothetical protein n=1 Tax=Pseudoalteromonas sp. MEBiC 03607 TaxID=2563601 RepID=UPI00109353CA|nr:hypothetical protein [Pseudoalteromonas sp. MEBiC 03607]TGV21228.1 hypothetical protein E5N72_14710 [Pseudoalteromonas sp. MEBiC 03607]
MKFIIQTFKKGSICFFFTPLLMGILIIAINFFGVTGETELPQFLVDFLTLRYSVESMIIPFLVLSVLSITVSLIYDNFKLSHSEKIRLSKFYNFLGYSVRNLIMFSAGWFFAWSFASHVVDFIKPIDGQEVTAFATLLLAFIISYFITKLKHNKVKGTPML